MTIWQILGIDQTKDEKQITQAYREKLSETNPEDKPEEFKLLRSAYEEALSYARMTDEISHADDEINEWLKDLQDLYDDFAKRKDVDRWEELLSREVCQSISGHMRIENELLVFLMDQYFIGHNVWLCMDRHFSFLDRREELYEKYPREFIDRVVINGILYPDILPMMLFDPGTDGDECHKYLDAYLAIRMEESGKDVVEQLCALKESHPYGDALVCCWKIRFEDPSYIDELKKIVEAYPEDLNLAMMLAREYFNAGDLEKAQDICQQQLVRYRDDLSLKDLCAEVLGAAGKYSEAVKQINEMMRLAKGDNRLLNSLDERRKKINESLILQQEAQLKERPDDQQLKIDLCWSYIENGKDEEGIALFETIDSEKADQFNYYNLMSSMAYSSKDYEKGIGALKKLIEVIDSLDDDSEENITRKKRKGEMYGRIAYFAHLTGDDEATDRAYEKALEFSANKADVLTSMTQMSLMKDDYEKAKENALRLNKENPGSAYSMALLAYAHFYLHEDQEAFDVISRAIDADGRDLSFYILKIRILIRNNAFDAAQEIIDYLDSCGLSEDVSVLYVKGLMAERKENDKEKAKGFYRRSVEQIEGIEGGYEFTDDLYYRLLCLEGEILNGNEAADRETMMKLAEKGLAARPSNKDLLEYKAWLLMKGKQYDDSLKIYLDLAKDENHSGYIDSQIGYISFQDLEHKAKESRDAYLKALEKGHNDGAHYYIGMCEMYMGHPDEAEEHFLALQKEEPDGIDSYLRLTYVYEMKNELDKALENADKLIDLIKDRKDDQSRYYLRKVQILRRMKEPEKAVEVVKYIMDRYDYHGKKMIFDIYMQFGMMKEATKQLHTWKWNGDYYDGSVSMNILQGNYRKARQILDSHGGQIERVRCLVLYHLLEMEAEDFIKEEKYLDRWLNPEGEKKDVDLSQVTGHLSYCAFHQKDEEKQHRYAQMSLKKLDEQLEEYSLYKTLYLTRKVRVLALLGRRKEAEELAEKIRKLPLCSHCPYHSCKDLDAFEMEMAEIFGDEEKALALAEEGNRKWPDEEDFAVTISRLKKKGIKKC